jgi:hypothetical protein
MKEAKHHRGRDIKREVVFVRIDERPWIGVKLQQWDLGWRVFHQSMSSIE